MTHNSRLSGAVEGVGRRACLRGLGAALAGSAALSGRGAAAGKYDRVINIADAGADDTGQTPIDAVLDRYAQDNTLIEFPNGRYRIDKQSLYRRSTFGMVAVGDDVTLVPNSQQDYWIAGAQMNDFRFEGFTIDCRASGIHPKLAFSVYDNLLIRDVEMVGVHDGYNEAFGLTIIDENGSGLVENLRMADGSTHDGYTSGGYASAATGVYADTNGALTFRNCHVEGFGDNGLYASPSSGPVKVEGGTYKNNDISQVRLGSDGSYVRGATIVVDDGLASNAKNARGVRISDGPSSANGRVIVEDCDIALTGGVGAGGVVGAYNGGAFTVRNCRIRVDDGYRTYGGNRAGYGVLADSPSSPGSVGRVVLDGCSITGSATENAAVQFRDRDDGVVQNACIHQPNGSRDGVEFRGGSGNAVSGSTINVAGQMVSGGLTSGLTGSGTCPLPSTDGSSGSSGSGGSDASSSSGGSGLPGEVGDVTFSQSSASEWHTLSYSGSYADPVLVMDGPTQNGGQPGHVRLSNVGDGSASYKLEEWMYLDGGHTTESVGYVAAEQGTGTLPGGSTIEVGTVATDHGFSGVSFGANFSETPVVLAQAQTYNGSHSIVTRLHDVSASGFDVRLQEEEAQGTHKVEEVGYVAIEPGVDQLGGRTIEAGTVEVGHDWGWASFAHGFDRPRVVAGVQTYNGSNPVGVRTSNFLAHGMNVRVEEEQSGDSELWHTTERVGYVAVETR